jgi:molybdenum transport protein
MLFASTPFRSKNSDGLMICLSSAEIDSLISEDLSYGDLTTRTLGFGSRFGRVRFFARGGMTVCCTEEAKLIFERLGAEATILAATGGMLLQDGGALIEARGSATALLAGWKIAQTLIEWSSGTASAVSQMVAAAQAVAPRTVVACTRKSVPFTRRLAAKAVHEAGVVCIAA